MIRFRVRVRLRVRVRVRVRLTLRFRVRFESTFHPNDGLNHRIAKNGGMLGLRLRVRDRGKV